MNHLTMNNFQDVSTISSRKELSTIWNYWTSKLELLKMNRETRDIKKQIANINSYLEIISERDSELISKKKSKSNKKTSSKKKTRENNTETNTDNNRESPKLKENHEYQELLVRVTEEVEQYKQHKFEISIQIENVNQQIAFLEKDMEKFSTEIGLTCLKKRLKLLKIDFNAPMITTCKHYKTNRHTTADYGYGEYDEINICIHCNTRLSCIRNSTPPTASQLRKEEREYQESLPYVLKEIEIHNKWKNDIQEQMDEVQSQIWDLQDDMRTYATEIGLTLLKDKLKELETELNKPYQRSF
jgi:chromosome segregation ATPase